MKPNSKRRRKSVSNTTNYEALEVRQLLAADIPDFVGEGKIGEVGTVVLDDDWSTISLNQSFNNPVVIAGPASTINGDPVTVRVRDVTSNSFQISIDEWNYQDGNHSIEIVSYLVVEGGTHQLTDGTRLVAGYVQDQTHSWESVSTGNFFNSTPVLFSQIMTDNDPSSATTRMDVLGNNDFEIRIQEEEAADDIHGAETVGFVAVEAAVGTSGDLAFQSFATSSTVTGVGTTVSFETGHFSSAPAFFADMQTFNDPDTATVRRTSLSPSDANVLVEEEQSSDAEQSRIAGESVGVLAIDNGDLIAGVVVQGSDRFNALEEHIRGNDTLTVAQLQSWTNAFASEAGSLGNRIDDFVAAVEVVQLYESTVGPLFTSQGVANFARSWNGDNNLGRGLARAMVSVYQAVFDAIDNDLVNEFPTIVEGTMFRSTENFPGSVPNPTDPTAIYEVQIDGTLNEEFGYVGGYSTNAARRMTGAYLAPGTIAEIIVPDELVNAGYQIRVGGHSWDLSNKNNVNRLFRVSNLFDITDNVVQVANPMGGNIYIEIPVGADAGIVDVQFRNTIRAPFFSNRTFDKTTQSEWNVERTHPGVFTDIESENSLFTVPTKWITNLGYSNLLEIIEAYDANMRVATEYAGKNPDRHKASLYAIVDTQIRGNAFSIGYPQSNWGSFQQNTIRAPLTLNAAFDKVLWHEHGHSEFLTMFAGETESLVHMAAFYIGVENYGFTIQESFAESLAYGSHNHTTSDALNSWVVMNEFINGQNMAFQQASYRPRGHADYVEYVEMFGLEAFQNYNRRINIEFDGTNLNDSFDEGGRTSQNYNSRILRLSREAGVNVAPLFHLWGHAPSNKSTLDADLAAEGLGDSAEIYDRMIQARNDVPLTQAEWNAVDSVMRDFLNENRGPWQELRTNYDVDRGQDAVNKIQELIDLYFPNGRPTEAPAVVPIAATVTAFSEPNFQGESWELTEGLYQIAELNAGPIGNDNISSILIPEGYEVQLAQWQSNAGTRAVYTESIADLGTLENDVSRVEVSFTLLNQEAIGESGTLSLNATWKTVTLQQSYNDPVVIAGTPSYEGTDPSTVRIRNVTSNSFEYQINEWDYLNPFHSLEVVSYMVVEAGQHTLADGTVVVAGNRTGQDDDWQTYSLGSAFDGLGAPIVLASVVTESDPATVTTRVRVNSNSEFEVRLQEQESANGVHGAETVSYFAIQSGAGATGGLYYDAGTFAADSGGQFESFDPAVRLSSVSSFFAGMQTFTGSDPAVLRNTVLNAAGVSVFVEEERSANTEVAHGDETIGFFAIAPGLIMGATTAVDELAAVTSVVRDEGGVLARPDLLGTFAVSFDANVNVSADDLLIRNETLGGTVVDTSGVTLDYSSSTQTATWDFSSLTLDAAYYSFELSDNIVSVAGNLSLDGDFDGNPGGAYVESVYVALPGDTNLDGRVNVLGDGFALVSNLGTVGGATWQQGDVSGDGRVNVLGDGFVMVGRLGQSVVSPTASLAAKVAGNNSTTSSAKADLTPPILVLDVDQVLSDDQDDELLVASASVAAADLLLAGSEELDEAFASTLLKDDLL